MHLHSTPSAHRDHEEGTTSRSDNEERLVNEQVDQHNAPSDKAGIHFNRHGLRTRQEKVVPSHSPAAEERFELFPTRLSQSPQHSSEGNSMPSDSNLHTTNGQRVGTQPVHLSLFPLRAAENDAITSRPAFLTSDDQENDLTPHHLSPTDHVPTDLTLAPATVSRPHGTEKASTRNFLSLSSPHQVRTGMVDTDLSLSAPHGTGANPVSTDLSLSAPHGREADTVPTDLSLSIEPTRAAKTTSYLPSDRETNKRQSSEFPPAVYISTMPHSFNHHYSGPRNSPSGLLTLPQSQHVQPPTNLKMKDQYLPEHQSEEGAEMATKVSTSSISIVCDTLAH
uniref:AlNc14C56G4250 protein n=1 Tax=Albugo laibachii Nc14 TaxID=890382 RepID=F0WC67_9STRA|nr:AlNc14C56G4250 [Albugo laibachii Nc14]|eukprot:CCA18780.1 AlNc14C56G4250 [Albugo laibachii Nc14]